MTAREQALQLLASLAPPETPAWKIEWEALQLRLAELVGEPWLIAQREQNLCGPAAFFAFWFQNDPLEVVRFALDMYAMGQGWVGEMEVAPSPNSLIEHDYANLDIDCPAADWMMLGALRDSENAFLNYEGDGGDQLAGVTTPGDLAAWMVATGCYTEVSEEANSVLGSSIGHALGLDPGLEDAAVLVNSRMLSTLVHSKAPRGVVGALKGLLPDHWVVLRAPLRELPNGRIHVRVWSYGAEFEGELDPGDFERDYYGAVRGNLG